MPVKPDERRMRARRTGYDVAQRAGVSQSAVSRCFRPGGSVSPETRKRVMKAADELGYRPNAIARGLITARTNLVAVVISNLTNLHYPEVLAALNERLSERHYRVLLFALPAEGDVATVLPEIWRYQVDGAIVAARLSPAQLREFALRGIPLVLYNREADAVPTSSVVCDFAAGAKALVDGLVASGRRRFVVIAGPEDSSVGEVRTASAVARLTERGLAPIATLRGDYSYQSGVEAARVLIAKYSPDAIVSANDTMALGAADVTRFEFGLAVPLKVSIVGFDGVAPTTWQSYRLTTIRQPVERMAEAAVNMLVERIDDPDCGAEQRRFPGVLVTGQSAQLGG